jgi:hypothetical protein
MKTAELRGWPFPGDAPLVRARKVALAYRAALSEADPVKCAALDDLMRRWGQTWAAASSEAYEPDALLTAREAADLASMRVSQIATLRRIGRLPGKRTASGWKYRAEDVQRLSINPRTRAREKSPS